MEKGYWMNNNADNKSLSIKDVINTSSAETTVNLLLYEYLGPIIAIIVMLTNLTVVISSGLILKKGQQPRSSYLFLGNIALADFATGFAVVFSELYPDEKRDHYFCAIEIGMKFSSALASLYSMALIGVDRFLYILYGMQYQRWMYPTRARLLISMSWALGIFIGFLPLMGWHGNTNNGKICWFIVLAPKGLVLLTDLIAVVPLTIVFFLYSIILYHAIRKIIQLQQADGENGHIADYPSSGNIRQFRGRGVKCETVIDGQPRQEDKRGIFRIFKKKPADSMNAPNKWKAIRVVMFTTGSFVITWCPYFIGSMIYVITCDLDNTSDYCKSLRLMIGGPLALLGFMNSLLNPIIYAWWHKGFSKSIKKKINSIVRRINVDILASNTTSGTTSMDTLSPNNGNINQITKSESSLNMPT